MAKTEGTEKNQQSEVVLRGIVIAEEWTEDDDEAPELILQTDDEEDIPISSGGRGAELLGHLREEVEIHGVLRRGPTGRKQLVVKSFEVCGLDEDD